MKEAIIQYEDTPSGGHFAISWKPLVRCKDCKKYNTDECEIDKLEYSPAYDDWFCADGERK